MSFRLLPEWYPCDAVILAWPDKATDWAYNLEAVRATYIELIDAINQSGCAVLLLIRACEKETFKKLARKSASVLLIDAEYNDTWTRDYGFLCTASDNALQAVEFTFNGWGDKFNGDLDNAVNASALSPLLRTPIQTVDLVCEGGALEIDEQGHLLSTALCLSNPKRNGDLSLEAYEALFAAHLGASKTTIFKNGHLEGDDTDGHIDTLVRYTPHRGIVIQSCPNRPDDVHSESLTALKNEVLTTHPNHQLFELPLPEVRDADGSRLPASYANFLICNKHVLLPIYQQQEDNLALAIVTEAFPDYKIIPVNCLPLVQQHGSLHCVTMQVPKGILKTEITNKFGLGINQL